jgi:hypothetical protein
MFLSGNNTHPFLSIDITTQVRIGNGISLHASAEAEAKNGKPGASGSAGIKMQW